MLASELNATVITQCITQSAILSSALCSQLGVSSDELVSALLNTPKWTVSKAGKWSLAINGKKLIANTSSDEQRIDFIVK
jgi:hypothetical protein